jgi:hypothetical protein
MLPTRASPAGDDVLLSLVGLLLLHHLFCVCILLWRKKATVSASL